MKRSITSGCPQNSVTVVYQIGGEPNASRYVLKRQPVVKRHNFLCRIAGGEVIQNGFHGHSSASNGGPPAANVGVGRNPVGEVRCHAASYAQTQPAESSTMVTGPSFTKRTCISAPNTPVGTGRASNSATSATNCRYSGSATAGGAAAA